MEMILILQLMMERCNTSTMMTGYGESCVYVTKEYPATVIPARPLSRLGTVRSSYRICHGSGKTTLLGEVCVSEYLLSESVRNASCSQETHQNEWGEICKWQTVRAYAPHELVIPTKYGPYRNGTITCGHSWRGEWVSGMCIKRILVAQTKSKVD